LSIERFVLYTTVYPGVEKYLPAWYESVLAQTDRNFDIWIGIDQLSINDVVKAIGADPSATWVLAAKGDSPARIREKAIQRMVSRYPAVIFADSDDVLEPMRVEAARAALRDYDVVGCAMQVISECGEDQGVIFRPPDGVNLATLLLRNNVFGLSNTAYRSEILRKCLPLPATCTLVDWFLITRAWLSKARLYFDFTPRMFYRQYPFNIARILPPFTPNQVRFATEKVLEHYSLILHNVPDLQPEQRIKFEAARNYVEEFRLSMESPRVMHRYVSALNSRAPKPIWWAYVAHPELEEIWRN